MSADSLHPLIDFWVVTGPTASGKSALALALAEVGSAEIISADSMQVYEDLPIATAAPTAAQRHSVPHHLVGMLRADIKYSVAKFLEDAIDAAQCAAARGRRVLIVGGTGLYIQAAREGLFQHPEIPEGIRDRLDERLRASGSLALHEELRRIDSAAAERIHPNDAVRVRRALEVFEATGRPISELWREAPLDAPRLRSRRTIVLSPPRETLYEWIDARTAQMFEDGLLAELDSLRRRYAADDIDDALRPLGVRDLVRAMERGEIGADAQPGDSAVAPYLAAMRQSTRRYAKRQLTWLRKHSPESEDCLWLDPAAAPIGDLVRRAQEFFGFGEPPRG